MPVVLLVGRPNVGKSTLFNKLTRTRAALVDDREGVTRDWIERPWSLPEGSAQLRDLCGFREDEEDPVLQQSQKVMQEMWQDADLLLFVVDARAGVTEVDKWVARGVRNSGKPVVLVANKAESDASEMEAYAMAELGWDPVPISAEHNIGLDLLEDAVSTQLAAALAPEVAGSDTDVGVAILGKPNAGKSTLLNQLLGEDRATVSEVAGTTRDPIDVEGKLGDLNVRFIDTAGIRRRRSIHDQLEAATVSRSIRSARESDVILYLIQAEDGITQQDQLLLSKVAEEGKGILLLLSHWDKIEDGEARFKHLLGEKERLLPFLPYAPMLTISGLTGHNVQKIAQWVESLVTELDTEVTTPELNSLFEAILKESPPPAVQIRTSRRRKRHKPFKLYYGTQSGNRPLRFKLFSNVEDASLPDSYKRFMMRRLREELGIKYVPILLHFENRKQEQRR